MEAFIHFRATQPAKIKSFMNKNLVIGVLLVVLAVGAYYMYSGDPMPSLDQGAAPEGPVSGGMAKHSIVWNFSEAGVDSATGGPKTKITLVWDGKSYDAGTYLGTCNEINGTSNGGITLQDGQLSGSFCYFAGYGDEVGVFRSDDGFILMHGEYQEPSAEAPAFRGNFKTIVTL